MSETLYLETTAVIDALFKKFPQLQDLINSSDKTVSSQYVKMEIRKGFLQNLVMLHNKAVHCDSISQVQQFAGNLSSSYDKYYLGAVLAALAAFFTRIENQRPDDLKVKYGNRPIPESQLKQLINFLRFWIRMFMQKIDKMVAEIMNPMQCFIDLEAPKLKDNLFDNRKILCSMSANECDIYKFFASNENDFTAILDGLKAMPEKDKDSETSKRQIAINKLRKKIKRNNFFSNKTQDENTCWDCGDAIHAVLAPKGSSVVNRNRRHFDPICSFIDRKSLGYSSPKIP